MPRWSGGVSSWNVSVGEDGIETKIGDVVVDPLPVVTQARGIVENIAASGNIMAAVAKDQSVIEVDQEVVEVTVAIEVEVGVQNDENC